MYLHIGKNKNIAIEDIIGIFDLDHATLSAATRRYLAKVENEGNLTLVAEELPKSFIVTAEKNKKITSKRKIGKNRVYLSQLNTQTLVQRSAQGVK